MYIRSLFSYLIAPVLFSLVVCVLLRALFYFNYPEYFSDLSFLSALHAFAYGVRFDLSITTASYALFFLVYMTLVWLGVRNSLSRYVLWFAYAVLALTWMLYLSSVVYFAEVNRHISTELLYLGQDVGFFLTLLNSSKIYWVLAAAAMVLIAAIGWNKLIIKPAAITPDLTGWQNKLAFSVLGLLIATLFIRGLVLDGKTLSIADAYSLSSEQKANLAMNGAFSVVHNTRRANKNKGVTRFFTEQELKQLEQKLEIVPFQRAIPAYDIDGKHNNVVVILLESWSAEYIDGLSGTNYGATPFMDELITKSRVWTNTFAAGQRSIEGVQAILASIPLLEGRQTLGWGLEQNRLTTLAKEADNIGYDTVMMQTSSRRSFHMDAIASLVGFNQYYGMEDFPMLRDYPVSMPAFGWDYEGLMFLSQKLKQIDADSPFFSFFFTGTTHEPFPDPGQEFHVYPHGENEKHSYLNTLRYSDWSLQQFMQSMQSHPAYQNTTFIFMADHVLKAATHDKKASFNIPLIVYSPHGEVEPGIDSTYVSQYDLLPTLASLMAIKTPIATFGRSLLTEKPLGKNGALSKQGNNYVWFSGNNWLTFDGSTGEVRDSSTPGGLELQSALLWNQYRLQLVNQLLTKNSWFSDENTSH